MKKIIAWIFVISFILGIIVSLVRMMIEEWPHSILLLGIICSFCGFVWGMKFLTRDNDKP